MDFASKIRAAGAAQRISSAEIARRIGTSPQALWSKLKTGKFSLDDLETIADVLGVKFVAYFELPDGTKF